MDLRACSNEKKNKERACACKSERESENREGKDRCRENGKGEREREREREGEGWGGRERDKREKGKAKIGKIHDILPEQSSTPAMCRIRDVLEERDAMPDDDVMTLAGREQKRKNNMCRSA